MAGLRWLGLTGRTETKFRITKSEKKKVHVREDVQMTRVDRSVGQSGSRASGNAGDHGADPGAGLLLCERLVDRRSDTRAVIAAR